MKMGPKIIMSIVIKDNIKHKKLRDKEISIKAVRLAINRKIIMNTTYKKKSQFLLIMNTCTGIGENQSKEYL